MKSNEDDSLGTAAGGGSGRPEPPDPARGKGGKVLVDGQELKTVRLVCLFCRDVRVIHVPVRSDMPREVLWECFSCQERWASRK